MRISDWSSDVCSSDLCTHVGVMYLGEFVEVASTANLFSGAVHPYTWSLAAASLSPAELGWDDRDFVVGGDAVSMTNPPPGCRFASRCTFSDDRCLRSSDRKSTRLHSSPYCASH